MIEFREIEHGSAEYGEALALRDRILRAPLGLEFSDTEIAAEAGDWHLGAFDGETGPLIGCLVFSRQDAATVRMRQLAIAETRRGRGIGRNLVRYGEKFARNREIRTIVLNAREPVAPFYEKLGYTVEGEPFTEVTLPHRRMRRELTA